MAIIKFSAVAASTCEIYTSVTIIKERYGCDKKFWLSVSSALYSIKQPGLSIAVTGQAYTKRLFNKNSSGDEIANVNFFYNIAHVEASDYAH